MHRFFVPRPFAEEMEILGRDAHHIFNVLRMHIGQQVQIVSSDGVTALMKIETVTTDAVFVRFVCHIEQGNEPTVKLILAQGLAKGEKMDFIVQKAVEIGVSTIIPVTMEHSVVKLDALKAIKKVERWQKIAEEAAKQSKRDIVPKVEQLHSFEEVLRRFDCQVKLIASESERQKGLKTALQEKQDFEELLLIVGPEGGIAPGELQAAEKAGFTAVSLGNRILRTETAGVVAAAAIFYETGDLGG